MSLSSSARTRILSSLLAQRVVCFSAVGGGDEPQTEVGLEKCRRFCFSMLRLDAKGCLARVFDRTLRPLVTEPPIHSALHDSHSQDTSPNLIESHVGSL
jgi:hypothetical protein